MAKIHRVPVDLGHTLDDYAADPALAPWIDRLRGRAAAYAPRLRGRTVWMVNSTATGGGVAEMLPREVSLLRQLGVRAEWVVIVPGDPDFFRLTKRLHNLLHGQPAGSLGPDDAALYARESEALGDALATALGPTDLLVVHDPQPLGAGAVVARRCHIPALWRCHIGLDRTTPETEAAWAFLRPWLAPYQRALFSLPAYVPAFLAGRSGVLSPGIDPLATKNRPLDVPTVADGLARAGLAPAPPSIGAPPSAAPVLRLQPDGEFRPSESPSPLALPFRPSILQVSRWDRLKGFAPLLTGFQRLRQEPGTFAPTAVDLVAETRLLLAGPDPRGVADDPEGADVLADIVAAYRALSPADRAAVAVLLLPMADPEDNARLVNVLQRSATVVAQNSLEEGFGLTVTEAMWKSRPVVAGAAAGPRAQIDPERTGWLVDRPDDPAAVARTLGAALADATERERRARAAHRAVWERFLLFRAVERWLEELAALAGASKTAVP
jgi:trehalose synthase